jgi:hypothetical protein
MKYLFWFFRETRIEYGELLNLIKSVCSWLLWKEIRGRHGVRVRGLEKICYCDGWR